MAIPFQYESEYKRKLCTPDEAARVVRERRLAGYQHGLCLPVSDGCRHCQTQGGALRCEDPWLPDPASPSRWWSATPGREHFIYNSWHMSGYERKLCDRGMCSFNPMVFRNLGAYYQHFLTVNVAMMCVTPMNQHGYFNFSLSNASARAVLDGQGGYRRSWRSTRVLPWVYGGLDECIHIDDVDMIVEGPHNPLPSIQTPPASEAETRIAEFVVENMDDGATLQLGIGSNRQRRGPRCWPSPICGIWASTRRCCATAIWICTGPGRSPTSARTSTAIKSVSGFAIGSEDFFVRLGAGESGAARPTPSPTANAPSTVRNIEDYVSINNCISVDLYGQICAESAWHPPVSAAPAVQLDFLEGADGLPLAARPSSV